MQSVLILLSLVLGYASHGHAAAGKVYYSDTIKNVIARDCSRCHSGASRNLMDYDQVKAYVDSGLLRAMVSPGGPMSRHAGNDGQTILDWIDQGSPEKPGTQLAQMTVPAGGKTSPGTGVYYSDTIKNIIAQDCSRCHSGATRNLMDYDQVKAYVDSGLLRAMVSPGGPMSRHAGNDGQTILAWIDQGSPEKPMTQLAQMTVPAASKPSVDTGVYYIDTIKNITARDCGRCHSGPVRNFMTYDKLKAYAASGLLKAMVSPGGAMNGMAGSDAPVILAWIAQGSPEKPGVQLAQMIGPGNGIKPYELTVPLESMTYENTIKFVLAKDCLECHSGQFRNLTTYAKVKYYVDNGLLRLLVSRGGQMHRFAGPDSRLLLQWAAKGAPQ